MEHESFESEATAAIMNQHFVNIKVDREERPDVDKVYMTFVQALTGGGGWPMSVWLTPELTPFYGGTYYPGRDSYGMPSFPTVLRRIAHLWDTKRDDLREQGDTIMEQLTEAMAPEEGAATASQLSTQQLVGAVKACAQQLGKRFDSEHGGFGGPPKFPRPSEINILLRAHSQFQSGDTKLSTRALHMASFTLQHMAAGGIFDHVGGGFHRYSVDEFWHVPHFEKMLYDNPQLVLTYLDTFRVTGGEEQYAFVARGVLDYLRRDMTHPEGGIYSAEDADSLDPVEGRKKEGAFYVWTAAEIEEVLGSGKNGPRLEVFKEVYGVKPKGNCNKSRMSDPHQEFVGKNVLIKEKDVMEARQVKASGMTRDRAEEMLAGCRADLHARRATRPRPALDDKIVTAWNGMSISAFASASRVLASEKEPARNLFPVDGCSPDTYMEAALKVAGFVHQHLYDAGTGKLRRAFCKAPSAVEGFADDYAYLIGGLLDLYECGGGLKWLQWAVQLQSKMDELFWDNTAGGYYQTAGADPAIKLRMKEDYDGAEPAASSIAAHNLIRLAALLPGSDSSKISKSAAVAADTQRQAGSSSAGGDLLGYLDRVDKMLAGFGGRLQHMVVAMPQMCCAAYLRTKVPLRQVIISGPVSDATVSDLLNATHGVWAPDKAVILINPEDSADMEFWQQHNPEAFAMVKQHYQSHHRAPAGSDVGAAEASQGTGNSSEAVGTAADMGLDDSTGPDKPAFPATAFVCQNFACQAPTSDPEKVRNLLGQQTGSQQPRVQKFNLV
eukprot:jgi/Chrzof1/8033/UNPLg00078.t1